MRAETEMAKPPTSTGNLVTMSLVATTMKMQMTPHLSLVMKRGSAQTEITHIPK